MTFPKEDIYYESYMGYAGMSIMLIIISISYIVIKKFNELLTTPITKEVTTYTLKYWGEFGFVFGLLWLIYLLVKRIKEQS